RPCPGMESFPLCRAAIRRRGCPLPAGCRRMVAAPAGRDGGAPGMGTRLERMLAWLLVLLLAAALPCAAHAAQPVLQLDPAHANVQLNPYLTYRHDSGAVDGAADAFRRVAAGEFGPLPGGESEFGFQPGAFWFHASVVNRNDTETRWVLVQQYSLSDFLDV